MSTKVYTKPTIRKLQYVSERELVFLNFLRNQCNRANSDQCRIKIELVINPNGISWQIDKGSRLP